MIISHQNQFIFIHCRKVAGSSMKVCLAPYLSPEDLMLGSLQEVWSGEWFTEPRILREALSRDGVRELGSGALRGRSWRDSLNKAVKRRHKRRYGLSSSGHPPAKEVKSAFPTEWERYFKFCFVRNPFERAVSDYLYLCRNSSDSISFSSFLLRLEKIGEDHHGRSKYDNWPMYTIDNQVAVDFIGRYENIADDFEKVGQRIGLPGLALTASEKRRDYPVPWHRYYERGDRERVERIYHHEIEAFGYQFQPDCA